jgi:hypothetical protein
MKKTNEYPSKDCCLKQLLKRWCQRGTKRKHANILENLYKRIALRRPNPRDIKEWLKTTRHTQQAKQLQTTSHKK